MVNSDKISANVAAEVLIALNYSQQDIINKIPHPLIKELEEISDKEYKIELDKSKSLSEQNLMPETFDVLAGIYLRYCAGEETKKRFYSKTKLNKIYDIEAEKIEKHEQVENNEKIENGKQIEIVKTNSEEIGEIQSNNEIQNNNSLQEVKKISWIKRLLNGIKSMFVR
jgi:hypothetical protein